MCLLTKVLVKTHLLLTVCNSYILEITRKSRAGKKFLLFDIVSIMFIAKDVAELHDSGSL